MTVAPPRDSALCSAPRSGRRRTLLVGAVVAVVVACVAVWVVAFSPLLGVRTVLVRGNRTLTTQEVRAAARIGSGSPLIRLDTAAIARRVEAVPEVRSASVAAEYPDRVVITIVERTAVGYVQHGGGYDVLDSSGVAFRTLAARPRNLPFFELPAGTAEPSAAQAVATVAADLPASLLRTVASIQALDPTAITLLLVDHRVVRWGSAERSADKARILPTLLSQPGTQFDLTDPDQVVAR